MSEKSLLTSIQHGFAGSIGAVMSVLILFPIDNVKLRMQIDMNNGGKSMSMSEKAKSVFKQEGLSGYYKGISSTILGNFISNFTYFMFYSTLKENVEMENYPTLKYVICTFIAGILTSVVTNPFWVIQTYQTTHKDLSIIQAVRMLGFFRLFKGLSASFILVLNPIINYMVYENMKILAVSMDISQNYLPIFNFCSGGLGKFCATMCTYPYQLLRTQSHLKKNENVSYGELIKNNMSQNGIKGLYVGLQAKMYQTVLNTAFTLMFYEEILNYTNYMIEHCNDVGILFGIKIMVLAVMCLYVQQKRIRYTGIYYVFFAGILLSMFGNFLYLVDKHEYQSISVGFFGLGLLFYIHSIIHNISRKKNRHYMIYFLVSFFVLLVLIYGKIHENDQHTFNLYDVLGYGLFLTLIVLSFMRYGKTSKKSYSFTILGVVCLALSARLMYIENNEEILKDTGVYLTGGVQILSYVLLVAGTTSHAKFQNKLKKN